MFSRGILERFVTAVVSTQYSEIWIHHFIKIMLYKCFSVFTCISNTKGRMFECQESLTIELREELNEHKGHKYSQL